MQKHIKTSKTHQNMQIRSEPEFLIKRQFLSCKNIWKDAEKISPYFAAPAQDGLDSLLHLAAGWPPELSLCPAFLLPLAAPLC